MQTHPARRIGLDKLLQGHRHVLDPVMNDVVGCVARGAQELLEFVGIEFASVPVELTD